MKLKELKKYIEIYYKRLATETQAIQKRELNLLWKAIKTKIKRDKEKKEALKAKRPKNPVSKKLEYDTGD